MTHRGTIRFRDEGIKPYILCKSEDILFPLVSYTQAVVDKGRNAIYVAKNTMIG